MKRLLVLFALLAIGLSASADYIDVETDINMNNFWSKNGKDVQKVTEIGTRIINVNKLEKRVPIQVESTPKVANAYSNLMYKTVKISSGILPYMDNDDEMAFVLGHEIAHSMDAHDGVLKWFMMRINTREYEYKADLIGIDLMTKAGYNPIAAITCSNKWMDEAPWDFFITHPVTSKRLMAMYKYIYIKYPWALKTDMVHNVNYENFTYSSQKEINNFIKKEKEKANKREELL